MSTTMAHLVFEEIMAGDAAEDISEVWALIDKAGAYAGAILDGSTMDGRTIPRAEDPQVREMIGSVSTRVQGFKKAAEVRHSGLAENQGVGSDVDEAFDQMYEGLIARVSKLADGDLGNAALQRQAGTAKYALANGHLLTAEILGGDEGEDFGEVLANFAAARASVEMMQSSPDTRAIAEDVGKLAEFAQQRYDKKASLRNLGAEADEAFDAAFTTFIEEMDRAEDRILTVANDRVAALQDETQMARGIGIAGFAVMLVLFVGSIWVVRKFIVKRLVDLETTAGRLSEGKIDTRMPDWTSSDELGRLRSALEKFKDSVSEQQRMAEHRAKDQANAETEKKRAIQKLADDFDANIGSIVETVSTASFALNSTAKAMSQISDQAKKEAVSATHASEQTTSNVQTVASATEEMTSTIAEISQQVVQASVSSRDAVTKVHDANNQMRMLADTANKIGEVVEMISSIAEQTNLLALNATIESARAGEAGKGFAVVAGEVKALAGQTAKATADIAQQITNIQNSTKLASGSMEDVNVVIQQVDDIATAIAAAMEEQTAATQEIAGNIHQASQGTKLVNDSVVAVSKASQETGSTSAEVMTAAGELASQTNLLKTEVSKFLAQVRAG
ncbi:methyl-accepting chemotaxis protein [uncultured Cohaesibacter sp.]|uniref:methyl-accepting chemotaxis protein n=1 Tax=uncultured Cohaesibacter sp. TaxID=1002546 RepID=UPI0029C73D24|nr:methyl-accepting chemotaxis protein [uncultured Cohaesibacter sp.]